MSFNYSGESEIVCLWVVQNEDQPTLESMMKFFKKHNPSSDRVRVVMADKDLVERNVLTQELPGSIILICLFHTLRTFKREVSTQKMGITSAQEDVCRTFHYCRNYIIEITHCIANMKF